MEVIADETSELSYPIAAMFTKIRRAIAGFPKATLFELRDRGYSSLFEQLVACVISIRTYDEVSLPCSLKLFAEARTPEKLAGLSVKKIDQLITPSTFHLQKAVRLREMSRQILKEFGGKLPARDEALQNLPGVGPKCAHLALGIAENLPFVGVDIHVHRVTNRWGYVRAKNPEQTMRQLEKKLPRSRWIEINELLVPFGKHICTGNRPRCSTCPVLKNCQQIGVTEFR
jgi:endonuclease-3